MQYRKKGGDERLEISAHLPMSNPLERNRNVSHHVKASRGIVTYLVITVIFSETIIGHYAAIYPTALCKVTIEDIVELVPVKE